MGSLIESGNLHGLRLYDPLTWWVQTPSYAYLIMAYYHIFMSLQQVHSNWCQKPVGQGDRQTWSSLQGGQWESRRKERTELLPACPLTQLKRSLTLVAFTESHYFKQAKKHCWNRTTSSMRVKSRCAGYLSSFTTMWHRMQAPCWESPMGQLNITKYVLTASGTGFCKESRSPCSVPNPQQALCYKGQTGQGRQ